MRRRNFLKQSTLAASAIATTGLPANVAHAASSLPNGDPFQLNYAPHLGMFQYNGGDDPIQQIEFMHQQGFRAFEDNELRNRPEDLQKRIGKTLRQLKMTMGVFVGHTIPWESDALVSGDADAERQFLAEIEASVAIARQVNARWITVVPGLANPRLDRGYQTANLVKLLKRAARIIEKQELVMVLEPLNFQDHPGLFLTHSAQAYQICKAVDSQSCKILFDIYHQQITEGNLINNIKRCWDEIAYFQLGDNPGRNEPTTGEINYRNVLGYIASRGYNGVLGMEHGNASGGKSGEIAVIQAYREIDQF